MESAIILGPKGSNDPNSCPGEVISPCYCFQAHPAWFPQRIGAVWMDAADLFVSYPCVTGVTDANRDPYSSFLSRFAAIWSRSPTLFFCLLARFTLMLPIQLLLFTIYSLIRLFVPEGSVVLSYAGTVFHWVLNSFYFFFWMIFFPNFYYLTLTEGKK